MGTKNSIEESLIFIPDISGFTSFINEVEIEHSTHIISEVLEIILESNSLDLKVSEIEGDAVLFYKPGAAPSVADLIRQAETMFQAFHHHLKFYESNRICMCGACSTANKLSLKFVAHHGHLSVSTIKSHEKLFGPDVTLAHRLLKNNVNGKEYVLFTEPLINAADSEQVQQLTGNGQLQRGSIGYDGIGEVNYSYLTLNSHALKNQEINKHDYTLSKYRNPVEVSETIGASLQKIHSVVTNVVFKSEWMVGMRKVIPGSKKLHTIGSKHQCITSAGTLEIEVTSQKIKEGLIEYGERTNKIKWLSPINIIYRMKRIADKKTRVSVRIHYKRNFLSKLYLDFPMRLMIAIMIKRSLIKLGRMPDLN